MDRRIATIQIGMTVLFEYPTPKGRNPPSFVYTTDGLYMCIIQNAIKKIRMAIFTL